jgi:hypothetical protein
MALNAFGGVDASGASVKKIWTLNLLTFEWTSQLYRQSRLIRRGAVASLLGPDRFILVGGDDSTSWSSKQPSAVTQVLDMKDQNQAGLPFPEARGRIGMVSVTVPVTKEQVRVVVIGGFATFKGLDFAAATALSDVLTMDIFNPLVLSKQWQDRTTGPQPSARGFAVGKAVSCLGLL